MGALEHLVASGVDVAAVVAPPERGDAAPAQRLDAAAERHSLRLAKDEDLYEELADGRLGDVDLVLSFLYWRLLRAPLIDAARVACLNFHPAPLPDMRGLGGFNIAILEDFAEWGVSAHHVDAEFDTGDLVRVDRFSIDREGETALSLDLRSQERLLAVFRDVVDSALAGDQLPRTPQGQGRYVTREEFEASRRVGPDDPPDLVDRRIRAFWYPPYDGATTEIGGRVVTVVDRERLAEVAAANRAAGIYA